MSRYPCSTKSTPQRYILFLNFKVLKWKYGVLPPYSLTENLAEYICDETNDVNYNHFIPPFYFKLLNIVFFIERLYCITYVIQSLLEAWNILLHSFSPLRILNWLGKIVECLLLFISGALKVRLGIYEFGRDVADCFPAMVVQNIWS